MVLLPLPLFTVVAKSDDFDNLILVQVLESHACDNVVVVLFSEEKAGLFQSFAVESVCILEDLADTLYVDVLSKDLFALFLE